MAPFPARKNEDGTVTILANDDFDPEDSSTLFEFLPGDEVRTKSMTLPTGSAKPKSIRVATDLTRWSARDREYWYVLFSAAMGEHTHLDFPIDQLLAIARRIRSETESGTRWHYPGVVAWAQGAIDA